MCVECRPDPPATLTPTPTLGSSPFGHRSSNAFIVYVNLLVQRGPCEAVQARLNGVRTTKLSCLFIEREMGREKKKEDEYYLYRISDDISTGVMMRKT